MLSIIFIVTITVGALILFMRRGWWRPRTPQGPPAEIPRATLALSAFMQGNRYLEEEKFPEATAAFHEARELDPKRAYVAERLAEVARRQHAVTATAQP